MALVGSQDGVALGERLLAANDPLLAPLLRANESEAEHEIERLIVTVAWPAIARVCTHHISAALQRHDADDISSAVSLRLVHRLRRVRASVDDAIQDVTGYVVTLTQNSIHDHLRRRFPQRARHKNRLRYLLTHDRRFDLWNVNGSPVCGLRKWSGAQNGLKDVAIDEAAVTRTMRNRERTADAVLAIFEVAGQAIQLEALVDFTATLWHIVDLAQVQIADRPAVEPVADRAETTATHLERREFLAALWREIQELRPMQRKALLLNLRDSGTVNVISLLVLTGTALFDDVAKTLEISPAELKELWDKLPLEDLEIAKLLSVTRQQVINLRKAARSRLHRRLRR